jgi:hypothetical protein
MKASTLLRRSWITASIACLATPLLATAALAGGPSGPATPTSVVLTSGNRALTAAWTESSSGKLSFVATAKAPGRPSHSCRTKNLDCKITSLANGVVYDVTVTASDRGGTSSPSADATQIVGVPSAPNAIRATADVASARVSWAPPKASGVADPTSYMATASPGGFSCSTSGSLVTPPARTCEIAGLASGTTYTVTVTATNSFGTGPPSRAMTVSPH